MQQETNSKGNGWLWPLWGVAAGVLGYVGHVFSMTDLTEAQRATGVSVVSELSQTGYHVGVVAGMFAVFCVLVLAAGWWRWANANAPSSIAGGLVPLSLVASAGAMILGYGLKGMLAIYLPGGIDGNHPNEGLYTLFIIDDMFPFMAWYGVAMAAAGMVWLSLREHRLPTWIGILSVLFVVAPVGVLIVTGLPGFPGVVQPLWLIIVSIGMALSLRRAPARVTQPGFATAAG
ncbi:MAG: hypothetical protein H0V47_10270 [Chloroflexia bacterium]|nr:hypothetical protein [Chloroflexia bacterium]